MPNSAQEHPMERPAASQRPRRRWWFRMAAILVGFSPLLVSELALRIADYGHRSDVDDPYIGFDDVHPLFLKNPETGRYEIPESRQTFFPPVRHRDVLYQLARIVARSL